MIQSDTHFLNVCKAWWDRDFHTFPSDNIGLYRYSARDKADYYNYILTRLANTEDAYFPFYVPVVTKEWPVEKKDEVMVKRLFIDTDVREGDTLATLWEKNKFFANRFSKNMNIFFSAGKGFHFYIHITPTPYGELHKYRDILYWNLSTWLQYLIDKRVFLSIDRICRITLTKHSVDPEHPSPVQWKIPITPTMTIQEILRESRYPTHFVDDFHELYFYHPKPIDWRIFLKSPHELL